MFPDWKTVLSGLGWGLGYFGMPHIIIRFMSVRSDKDLRKSAKIGISWNILIILFSVAAGCIAHLYLGEVSDNQTVFIQMVRQIFPALISGILLSAILAASMSTADSQLLCASSAFASDVYKPVIRKNKTSDKEMFWAGRIVVLVIAVIAVLIASNPASGSIMDLVENAWGIFGAAFGPAILLSLFWKRFTFWGAVSGIAAGAGVDIAWLIIHNYKSSLLAPLNMSYTGIFSLYEIIPGFIAGLVVAVIVTLIDKKPKQEVQDLYDLAVSDQID
jgi:sodium/proline symporter